MRKAMIPVLFLLALLITAGPARAQQPPEQKAINPAPALKGKIFQLTHRSPRVLVQVLQPLTSGSPGAVISASEETQTISVRDFPENLEAIESAIRLLDKPDTASRRVGLEIQISLIAASQEGAAGDSKIPPFLDPVIAQLQRTLLFKNYRYITTLNQRTLDQGRVGASGAIANFFPGKGLSEKPASYDYSFRDVRVIPGTGEKATIHVGEFEFTAAVPFVTNVKEVELGIQSPKADYQRISMATGLSLREGEQVVVGTSSAGGEDKAVIVVVSIRRTGT